MTAELIIIDPENPPEDFRSINWAINREVFFASVISVATDYQKPLETRETAVITLERFLPHLAGMMIPRETIPGLIVIAGNRRNEGIIPLNKRTDEYQAHRTVESEYMDRQSPPDS